MSGKSVSLNVLAILVLTFLTSPPRVAAGALRQDAAENEVRLDFPDSATFAATLRSSSPIISVVLEYGNRQLTCGEVIAKAFPAFESGEQVRVEWTWEMRQSGSLPPGTELWWRWRFRDEGGIEHVTPDKTAVWIDDDHGWKVIDDGGEVRLHWYGADADRAEALWEAAGAGLEYNETQAGLSAASPIDIYVYDDLEDMRDAILYEPSWTGGMAFPEFDIVILGVSEYELDWGRDAIVHELTHVLVGHLTFSCLGAVPTWLNEGLAVYAEGGLDAASQEQFDRAVADDSLLPVRSLSGGFSEVSSRAMLSYSQSYSLVDFLIDRYGQKKMSSLLVGLRDGGTIDEALLATYDFDVDGLEDQWRTAIGAWARRLGGEATAMPSPTYVPTIVPISGLAVATAGTPEGMPTPGQVEPTAASSEKPAPPLWLTLSLVGICCALLLLVGVIVLAVVLRSNRRSGTTSA